MKRVACCLLNTREEGVQAYALELIDAMRKVAGKTIIVVRREINELDLRVLEGIEDCIVLKRPFEWDGWAFKIALEEIKTEAQADEWIFFRADCFGPVCSVQRFLESMEQKPGDFWALTGPESGEINRFYSRDGLCSVMGFRKALLQSEAFWSCLDAIKPGWNETALAARDEFNLFAQLEKRGFRGETLFDAAEGRYDGEAGLIADRLIERKRCPFIPLTLFGNLMEDQRRYYTDAAQFKRLLQWIRDEGVYDERLLWGELLPNVKLSALREGFQLDRLLSAGPCAISPKKARKTAIVYLPSSWHAEAYRPYIDAFCGGGARAVMCYRDESVREKFETDVKSDRLLWRKIEGTEEAIVEECLVKAQEVIHQSEYVCCLLDYSLRETKHVVTYEQYTCQQVSTLLRDGQRIDEIIGLFEQEKCLGMVDVLPPAYGEYYNRVAALVDQAHIGRIRAVYEDTGIPCPFDEDDDLLPAVFWARADVLEEALLHFRKESTYQAVGKEIFAAGYVIHRCAQALGYYPVRAIAADSAMTLMENQRSVLREINRKIMDRTQIRNWDYDGLMTAVENANLVRPINRVSALQGVRNAMHEGLASVKRRIPEPLRSRLRNLKNRQRQMKERPLFTACLVDAEQAGRRVRLTVMSDEAELDDCLLYIGVRKFYNRKDLCKDCSAGRRTFRSVAVFEVPQDALADNGANLRTQDGKPVALKWLNWLEKKKKGRMGIALKFNAIHLRKVLPVSDPAGEHPVKRLGIYFFYDAQGVVDEYVTYYLEKFRPLCTETCVVVNGVLNEEGRKRLQNVCDRLIVRENVGFDSQAYKKAILSYGYDQIAGQYDELVLHNFTNFGPIFPIEEMMEQMTARECDFWGHCRYVAQNHEKMGDQPVVDHLMSYFLTFKKTILQSDAFRQYWETLCSPTNYIEAVVFHEMRCTPYFEKLGFISDAYMSSDKYRDRGNAPVFCPYKQLVEDRSPLLKRKVFFVKDGYFAFQMHYQEPSVYELLEYIRDHTDYDPMMILENIERTQDLRTSAPRGDKKINYTPFSYRQFLISCEGKEESKALA